MNEFNNTPNQNQNQNGTGYTPPQYGAPRSGDANKTTANNAGWPPQNNQWQQPQPSYNQNYRSNFTTPPPAQATAEEYKWNFAEYENNAANAKKPKKKNKGIIVFASIVCSMLAIAVVGFAGYGVFNLVNGGEGMPSIVAGTPSADDIPTSPELSISSLPSAPEASVSASGVLSTKQIATKVQPSVVGIVAYLPSTAGNSIYGFGSLNAMQMSEGSGIIMSSDGYIITNAHVVEGATGMKVVLNNNEEYEAKLVGSDIATDLAVIKIEANNLIAAEFGDSTQLAVGEDVVAIGNPGGLEFANSLTKGVVSGVNRPIKSSNTDSSYAMNCIQTDAAINPGNSGGALVNEYGQVIGINSSKISATSYEGLGFAIPISEAKPIVDDIIANGRVTGRVRLGITGAQIDETSARFNNVPVGFQVYTTESGADIAAKGILPGDVITKIDDKEVTSKEVITSHLRNFKVGDKVTLTVFRRTSGRQDSTFEVTTALVEDTGTVEQQQSAKG